MGKLWALIFSVLLIVAAGCEEKDVPIIIDVEEVARYINDSDVGRQLFRKDNLIPGTPYEIPGDDGAVYTDVVDSVVRTIDVYIVTDNMMDSDDRRYLQDLGSPIGVTKDAEATVDDRFYVHTTRVEGTNSTTTYQTRLVRRYGYFVKLGQDDQRFAGWYLWSYNGGGAFDGTEITVYPDSGASFIADTFTFQNRDYILLDATSSPWDTILCRVGCKDSLYWLSEKVYIDLVGDPGIEQLTAGESVRFDVVELSSSTVFHTMSFQTDSGYSQVTFLPGETYNTASMTVPSRPLQWNLVFFQEFRRNPNYPYADVPPLNQTIYKGWCVAYRVAP